MATMLFGLGTACIFTNIHQLIPHYAKTATVSTLVFDDEFNGASGSAPDASKWDILGGTNPDRWGEECFVDNRSHIYLNGQGQLVETATYNPGGVPCKNGSGDYESGGMDTGPAVNGLFNFQYGTVEANIKVPCQSGTGLWPAFWSDGANWPSGGEIDYLEVMKGYNGTNAKQSLHGPSSSGSWNIGNNNIASTQWCTQYHTYGAIWSPGKIEFTIDGNITATDTPHNMQSGWSWPFDISNSTERLLIDLQVGSYGGTVNNSTLPQSMLVNWIRVYQNKIVSSSPTASITTPSNGTTVSGTVPINISASDSVSITNVNLLVDNTVVKSITQSPWNCNWNSASVANGTHTLEAKVYDAAGNVGVSKNISITVHNNSIGGNNGGGSGGTSGNSARPSNGTAASAHQSTSQSNTATYPGTGDKNSTPTSIASTTSSSWIQRVVNTIRTHLVAYSVGGLLGAAAVAGVGYVGYRLIRGYILRKRLLRIMPPHDPDIHIG